MEEKRDSLAGLPPSAHASANSFVSSDVCLLPIPTHIMIIQFTLMQLNNKTMNFQNQLPVSRIPVSQLCPFAPQKNLENTSNYMHQIVRVVRGTKDRQYSHIPLPSFSWYCLS